MRWFKTVLLLLIATLLVGGGGYAYVWYKAKAYIDDTLMVLLPGYRVHYEALVLDPRGEVRIESLQATPFGYESAIKVANISIRADAPLFFLQPSPVSSTTDWPSFLAIKIDKLRLDLASDFMETALANQSAAASKGLVNIAALGCGDVREFSLPELRDMGYPELQADLTIRLDPDNDKGRLVLGSQIQLLGIASQRLVLEVSFTPGYLAPQTILAASPRVQRFQFAYQDLGFNARRDTYCAEQTQVTEADYRLVHADLLKAQASQLGMQVPERLWNAYEQATAPGSNVELGISPAGGVGSELFVLMNAPHVLAERLNPSLRINSEGLDLAGLDWETLLPDAEQAEQLTPQEESLVDVEQLKEKMLSSLEVQKLEDLKRFYPASFDELDDYLQHQIRLYTDFGRQIEGRLIEVTENKLVLLRRVDQGYASYSVDRNFLETIEVYR